MYKYLVMDWWCDVNEYIATTMKNTPRTHIDYKKDTCEMFMYHRIDSISTQCKHTCCSSYFQSYPPVEYLTWMGRMENNMNRQDDPWITGK